MLSSLRMVLACGAASAVVGAGSALVVTTATSDDAVPVSSPMYGCMDVTAGSLYLSDSGTCADDLVPVTWQGEPQAVDGAVGADGEDGSNGEDGLDGADGSAGAAGAQGAAGANGEDGEDGAEGEDGANGEDGADGAAGAAGAKGDQGEKGDDGAAGVTGAKGEKGDDGAVGATGAKGDKGDDGAAGATGAKGDQGEKGDRGDDGVVPWSAVSAWSASTTYSAGPPAAVVTRSGSTYVAARSSIAADPATSPADWILVAAAGAKGDQGEKGDPGAKGDQGDQGSKGDQGATGLTGETGAEGPAGPTGPAGPAGPAGPMGPQGPAGNSLLSGQFNQWQGTGRDFQETYDCTIGSVILAFGTRGIPADGRTLSIQQYTALFSVIGTTFGGNGSTSFQVPDLRAVTPNGMRYSICALGIYPASA